MADELKVREFNDFMYHQFPPIEYVVKPWLPARGLAMVSGWRGIGKTYFSLSVAYAIATGGTVLGWECPRPQGVLYVDGEMDPAEFQQRLRQIDCAARRDRNGRPGLAAENLAIMTHADQLKGIPDLSDELPLGRRAIELAMGSRTVLILDNLSCICRSGDENDSASWLVMQDWLIRLRRMGKTVVLLHHTGKPNEFGTVSQRGTSKREDVLNTSIMLEKAKKGGEGFKVKFEKNRGFTNPGPMDVRMVFDADGEAMRLQEGAADLVELARQGLSQAEIAKQTGKSQSTVSRALAKSSKLLEDEDE